MYRYSHKTLHAKHQRAVRHYRVQLPYTDIDCVVPTPPEAKWYFLTTHAVVRCCMSRAPVSASGPGELPSDGAGHSSWGAAAGSSASRTH